MAAIFGLYLLFCLPGVIAAAVIRRWAQRQNKNRNERAWLVAITIGVLCSPGLYPADGGMLVVPLVVPSIVPAVFLGVEYPRMWIVFAVSTAVTSAAALCGYLLLSQLMHAEIEADEEVTVDENRP